MNRLCFGVLLVVLAAPYFASDAPGRDWSVTENYSNGRLWIEMKQAAKIFYVTGIQEGVAYFTDRKGYPACNCTIGDVVKGIDAFYASDPAYSSLPIVFAMEQSIARANGTPRDEINRRADAALRHLKTSR